MSEHYKIINSGNTPDIGKIGKVVKYTSWGGVSLEIEAGVLRPHKTVVTLSMGDVERVESEEQ